MPGSSHLFAKDGVRTFKERVVLPEAITPCFPGAPVTLQRDNTGSNQALTPWMPQVSNASIVGCAVVWVEYACW